MRETACSNRALAVALALILFLAACAGATPTPTPAPTYAQAQLLVETGWLAEHLQDEDLRLIDVRSVRSYEEGHIPGAVNLNPAELNVNQPVRAMLGPAEHVVPILARAGISSRSRVLIYDDSLGLWATRLFWALEYYGQERVSLLNGGFPKWQAEGRAVTQERVEVAGGDFTPRPQPSLLASKEFILENASSLPLVLIDVRSPQEYGGEELRSARGGHISGAINVPWELTLTSGPNPVFKPQSELNALYFGAANDKDKEVVVYCQTGVRAAHTYFVLRLIGYNKVRLYDGSWEEWGNDPALPVEK